jgi:hypothetical protein
MIHSEKGGSSDRRIESIQDRQTKPVFGASDIAQQSSQNPVGPWLDNSEAT